MPFPSPPWRMTAQMWVSLFLLPSSPRPDRPSGLYGAAFVDYQAGSPLTYHELLVARPVRDGHAARVRVTDIWVDSEQSKEGGRSLWGIPKGLADLPLEVTHAGPVERTTARGLVDGRPVATARFTAVPGAAVLRTPFSSATSQLREDGSTVVAPMTGNARSLPCLGSWDFDAHGPLGFLNGRRPVVSFRLADLRLTFG